MLVDLTLTNKDFEEVINLTCLLCFVIDNTNCTPAMDGDYIRMNHYNCSAAGQPTCDVCTVHDCYRCDKSLIGQRHSRPCSTTRHYSAAYSCALG